jgi:hypothetical protein
VGSNPPPPTTCRVRCGVVVQLVRTPACHAGGRGFESLRPRHSTHTAALWAAVFVSRRGRRDSDAAEPAGGRTPLPALSGPLGLRPPRLRPLAAASRDVRAPDVEAGLISFATRGHGSRPLGGRFRIASGPKGLGVIRAANRQAVRPKTVTIVCPSSSTSTPSGSLKSGSRAL